jgi:hypothetical protein
MANETAAGGSRRPWLLLLLALGVGALLGTAIRSAWTIDPDATVYLGL